jgi:hypothetical protein
MWFGKGSLPCPAGGMSCIQWEMPVLSHRLQMDGILKFLTDEGNPKIKPGIQTHSFKGFDKRGTPDIFKCEAKGPQGNGGFNYGRWWNSYKPFSKLMQKQKACATFDQCLKKTCYCAYSLADQVLMGDKWYKGKQPEVLAWVKQKKAAMHIITPYPWFKLGMFVQKFHAPHGEIALWPNPTPTYSNNKDPKGPPVAHAVGDICYLPWDHDAVTVIECDTNQHKYFLTGPFSGCTAAIASLSGYQKGGVKGKFLAFHMNFFTMKYKGRPQKVDAMKDMLTFAMTKHDAKWEKALFYQDAYVFDCFDQVFIFGETGANQIMNFWVYGSKKILPDNPKWAEAKKHGTDCKKQKEFLMMPLPPWIK